MPPENTVERMEPEARELAPAITPMDMLQIAVEKGADLDQLQKLMDLQDRWEANQSRKAYVRALSDFKSNPPTVLKNKHVGFGEGRGKTEFDHATLDQVCAVMAPALSKCGLSHGWSVDQNDDGIAVTCTLTHEDGHSESVTIRGPADVSGSKNSIQAIASTVTYLSRYTLLAITGLAAADQDDDGAGADSQPVGADQVKMIQTLIDDAGKDARRVCDWLNISSLAEMDIKDFRRAVTRLEEAKKQNRLRAEQAQSTEGMT